MKTVSLALLAAVTATSLALGASKEEKTKLTKWKITGQLEEACSCNAACPCWFDSKPTRATCGGNQVLFIQKGNYGNVKLDGLAVANYAQSPENQTMMDSFGKWNFSTNYIDEKASPEQRKALEAIAAAVLPSNNGSKNFKTVYVPITRKIEGKDHIITIGNVATFTGHLVEGGLGGSSKITNPPGADPVRQVCGRFSAENGKEGKDGKRGEEIIFWCWVDVRLAKASRHSLARSQRSDVA
ncbi:MAG: DUF1326 domain-containing protein [Verrucomicrobia bacterium]|nr:MAG: DUF1326 domain-containing protein [Verrucomicrobiota bacterium]